MILLNDFKRQWQDTREAVLTAVEEVGQSGWYVLGREVEQFEAALAQCWGLRYAAGTASGLDALEMSLRALGLRPGDRVLTTPLSAFATTLAIVKAGGVPVFVDTDQFGLIDLERCEQVLTSRGDIRFFVPVHLYGHALDMQRVERLRERFGLALVEDCAQSIVAQHCGSATGTAGGLAATSFYPTKNLGALGDGGAVLSDDEQMIARVKQLRDYGQSAKYRHDAIGYNSRLDELHAAMLRRALLPKLVAWTERRREIAARYRAGLRHPGVSVAGAPAASDSCWHLFPVYVAPEQKSHLAAHLKSRGVLSGEHYPTAIPDQPAMTGVPHELADDCATARRIAASELSLPIHPYLTDREVEQVIEIVNDWSA